MREIVSPLSGIRSPFGSIVNSYKVAGFSPEYVADFERERYRVGGAGTSFSNALTATATTNRTMVDSDGLLKWAPHNLLVRSQEFDSAIWNYASSAATVTANQVTAPDGTLTADEVYFPGPGNNYLYNSGVSAPANSKFSVWLRVESGTETLALRTWATGQSEAFTVTSEWQLFTLDIVSAEATAVGLDSRGIAGAPGEKTVYAWGAHVYRSDLGGMVNNPDRGDSYVPTTSAAVYLPRRGHHVYNGTSWVNEGILVEPTAATNLQTNSNSAAAWTPSTGLDITANSATSPDGTTNAILLENDGTAEFSQANLPLAGGATTQTASLFVKANSGITWVAWSTGNSNGAAWFDIQNGTIGTEQANVVDTFIEDCGNGWYRISVSTSAAGALSPRIYLAAGDGSVANTPANGSVLIYQVDQVAASEPSSPIPTAGSTATRAAETLTVDSANLPSSGGMPSAVSIAMEGRMTYADTGVVLEAVFVNWETDANNQIENRLQTNGLNTGRPVFTQYESATVDLVTGATDAYSPGINVPFNIASRHGSTFINGAVDGTALTANTTPTALPDLSSTDLQLAQSGGPMIISKFRVFGADIGDTGIAEASS